MSAATAFFFGFSVGCLFSIYFLVRPLRNLCNRWMAFYADDIKAAKARADESEQALAPAEPKTGAVN